MAFWALVGYGIALVLAASLVAFSVTDIDAFGWASVVLFVAVLVVREIARAR